MNAASAPGERHAALSASDDDEIDVFSIHALALKHATAVVRVRMLTQASIASRYRSAEVIVHLSLFMLAAAMQTTSPVPHFDALEIVVRNVAAEPITTLRFAGAPGVEFLHYVAPAASEPRENVRPFDLIATRTVVIEPSATETCKRLTPVLRSADGCLLRDPDGHCVGIRSSDPKPG